MGFLSATTSILSELDDSACQRQRSVGGFLLRLAAYVKRILRRHEKKKMHQSRVYTKLYTTVWDGKPEAAMPVDNQQPTGLPLLHRIPVRFKANQCCSYVRCDELKGLFGFGKMRMEEGVLTHPSKQQFCDSASIGRHQESIKDLLFYFTSTGNGGEIKFQLKRKAILLMEN